jgi:hypothetical protein
MLALLPCPAHFPRSSAFSVIGLLLVMIGIFLIVIVRGRFERQGQFQRELNYSTKDHSPFPDHERNTFGNEAPHMIGRLAFGVRLLGLCRNS